MSVSKSSGINTTSQKKAFSAEGKSLIDINLEKAKELINSDIPAAAKLASEALELSSRKVLGDFYYPLGKANALLILAEIQQKNSNLNESARLLKKALGIFESIPDFIGITDCKIISGKILNSKAKSDEAFILFDEAYSLALKISYNFGLFNALLNKANILLANGDSQLAEKTYHECLKISKKLSNNKKSQIYKVYSNLGAFYSNSGKIKESLKYYNLGLKVTEEFGNINGKIILCLNITCVYNQIGEYQKAYEISENLIPVCKSINDEKNLFHAYSNLVAQSSNLNLNEKAFEYAMLGYKLVEKSKDKILICHANLNLGMGYFAIGQLSKAEEYYKTGIKIAEEFHLVNELTEGYRRLSKISKSNDEILKSIDKLIHSANLLKNSGYTAKLSIIYKQIAFLYEKINKLDKSVEYHKLSDELNKFNKNLLKK
ncbi:MAG TPA: tetratricopeptide repeat protein [Ignavibacteria bacterium]|nr:tetratricopeptide repeat protein [Ignavibacteria bacterium]